jgi:hypothetical protein
MTSKCQGATEREAAAAAGMGRRWTDGHAWRGRICFNRARVMAVGRGNLRSCDRPRLGVSESTPQPRLGVSTPRLGRGAGQRRSIESQRPGLRSAFSRQPDWRERGRGDEEGRAPLDLLECRHCCRTRCFPPEHVLQVP